jgi:hypothetical protein
VLSNGRGPPCGDETGKFSSSPSTSHEHVRQHQGRTPLGGRTTTKKKRIGTPHGARLRRLPRRDKSNPAAPNGPRLLCFCRSASREGGDKTTAFARTCPCTRRCFHPTPRSLHPPIPAPRPRVVPLRLASQFSPRRRRPPLTCAREPIGTQHCPVGQELRRQWACTEAWCPRGSAFCRPLLDVNSRAERQVPAD